MVAQDQRYPSKGRESADRQGHAAMRAGGEAKGDVSWVLQGQSKLGERDIFTPNITTPAGATEHASAQASADSVLTGRRLRSLSTLLDTPISSTSEAPLNTQVSLSGVSTRTVL